MLWFHFVYIFSASMQIYAVRAPPIMAFPCCLIIVPEKRVYGYIRGRYFFRCGGKLGRLGNIFEPLNAVIYQTSFQNVILLSIRIVT